MKLWWKFVHFGFRLLYNELAFTYDLVSQVVSLGAWRCWQRASIKHLDPPASGSILELAHGTGNLQLDLRAAGYQTVGCDLSPYMSRIARHKLGIDSKLVQGRAQQLPFASESFAQVVSTFPAAFILEPGTLYEVYRVLQPGGRFVIVPSGILTGGGVPRYVLEWLYRVTGQRREVGFDMQAFFAWYGFEAEQVQEACPHSVAYVVIARKPPENCW